MGNLFAELKRRHIYRVAAAYAVVAWVLLQLVNNLAPIFELPPWIARAVVLLLIVGFPITLLIAWMRELAPADGATVRAATGKLDWALMGALVAVLGAVLYQQLAFSPGVRMAQQASVTPAAATPAGISIAVLPFANVSGDASREFFSDGMTDEISGTLAKVADLHVIARSSAFQFKGQNQDVRAVGQALGASHLIEGSVRQVGNRVRITAQLVRAGDGVQLWSENYDRELTDIFAIQEDIATAIAASLRVPLGLKQGESLVPSRTANLDSYQDYLRAKALVRARGQSEPGGPLTEATKLLEQVVARDSNYAPAWALLGQAYSLIPAFFLSGSGSVDELRRIREESYSKAETAAQRAIRLDPSSADGYTGLASVQGFRRKFIQAEDLLKQALSLDPGNPEALQTYSIQLAAAGRLKDSLVFRQRLQALEPFVPVFSVFTAQVLWLNGQNDAAIAILKALPPDAAFRAFSLAEFYAAAGRYGEAADALLMTRPGIYLPGIVETAARLLRTAPAQAAAPQSLPRLGIFSFVYLYVGAPERALEPVEDSVEGGGSGAGAIFLWHSSTAALRKTERFKALVRNAGFVDYWRTRGWPDLCRPVGADDFVCD